jgi:pimeloyl-ACP methyl ester carboxylesterase
MIWIVYAALGFLLLAGMLLTGVWAYYFKSAVRLCEEIGSMGNGKYGVSTKALAWNSERCEFTTSDGMRLCGSYLRTFSPKRLGVVVFCHEFRADRAGAFAYLNGLCEDGYDVFSFDFRNHGESQSMSSYAPRAWPTVHELNDVAAAIDYVCSRDDADPRGVILLGVSKGGVTALCAASRLNRVRAVVTDGAFVISWVMGYNIRRFLPRITPLSSVLNWMPWFLFTFYGRLVHRYTARKLGHDCLDVLSAARHIEQPVLLVHGERDKTIPAEFTPMLRRRIGGNCRTWIVPKARHNEAAHREPAAYQRKVRRFLAKHFGRDLPERETAVEPQLSEVH